MYNFQRTRNYDLTGYIMSCRRKTDHIDVGLMILKNYTICVTTHIQLNTLI